MDAAAFKQHQKRDWAIAAPFWRRYDQHVQRANTATTRRLLDLAGLAAGHRVLDIASGTGEPGFPAAEMVGPSGFVLLTDQSPEMLSVARDKANAQGLHNVEFLVSDAEALQLEPGSFDAVICRGALDAMPDPVRCLRIAYKALKTGGRVAVAVTGRARANPYFTIPSRVLGRYASLPETDPQAPGAFALASVDRLRSVLAEAGFRDLHVETIEDKALEFETGREYWDYIRGFSMAESVLAQIPADQHESIGEEIAAMAAGGDPDGRVELMGEWNLASGVK